MGRKRKNKADNKLPERVYRGKSAYEFRTKSGKCFKLCKLDAPLSVIHKAHEEALSLTKNTNTVKHLIDEYLASTDFCEKSSRTQKDYHQYQKDLTKGFGHMNVNSVTKLAVKKFLDAKAKKSGNAQANRHKSALQVIFVWALLYEKVKTNPCVGVTKLKEKAVLTAKHGSFRKSFSDHPMALKSPLFFITVNKTREFIERSKHFKNKIAKEYSKQKKVIKRHLTPRHFDNIMQSGHGRYSTGRFIAEPNLAKRTGCIYLAMIPAEDETFYLKVGISKYLNATRRKNSLPKGTIILASQQAELHRCFQAEQVMLKELKRSDIIIPRFCRFEVYSEVLALISAKSSIKRKYIHRLRSALKETKSYEEFFKK